ncbi:hypothetical protein NL676_028790 [Syzygium grande]|nr:hypothetical protein NL676_028790 [Syzygium grande]
MARPGRVEIPAMYRLESSDGPGNVLIACNLNGDNYLTWSREAAIFLVKGGGGPNNVGKQQQQSSEARLVCEHCGKLAHTNNNCWALNGYPAWYMAERSKGKKPIGQGRGTGQSQWKRGWPRVKTPNPQGPDRANAVQTINRSRADRLEALPDDQFQKLLNLLASDTNDYDRLVGPHFKEDPWSG